MIFIEQKCGPHIELQKVSAAINGRVVHYETLIRGARESYGEYLKKSDKVDRLDAILRKLK